MRVNSAEEWAAHVVGICEAHAERPFIAQHESGHLAYSYADWAQAMGDYSLPCEMSSTERPVIMLFDNTTECLLLFFVMLARGVKPVLMHRGVVEETRKQIAGILGCEWVITSEFGECHVEPVVYSGTNEEVPAIIDDDVAYLVFTSGSSGQPKGIQITYANMIVEVESMTRAYRLGSEDNHLCVLPIYHASGLYRNILIPFFCGARTTLVQQWEVGQFWELVSSYNVQFVQVTPTVINGLLHHPSKFLRPERLRYVGSASAPHPEELVRAFEDRFEIPLAVGYGMTEATCGITLNAVFPRSNYSVGKPIDAVTLSILRDGEEVPMGEEGEIAISGENLMRGYVNVDENEQIRFEEGLLYTGDLGYVDEDGCLYIVGRNNDIVKRGDYRLNLLEIERAMSAVSEVEEVCVIDVPHTLLGSDVVAFLKSADGVARRSREWLRLFKGVLETAKMPSEFLDIEEIPRFGALKVNRRALRERYQSMKDARKKNS